ncbi:potassium/proton antiporter [Thiobacillus denitrificans]|uniref:Sodium:proton exchanger n=1 Tax=Thiobacillus denitrificans TaxID=36861 RepID=A0A106BRF2_THIDE|nr:potassium/proton antiporter [Thiobacillus denitrificans]KVW97130.1 sodium:proton exchanger [Thiobacillus denitrificans]
MDLINQLVLAGAVLLLLAILASALSYRIGMPLLLVFLAVGMLAGEDGPGGILFNDSGIAYTVGSVALAIILLDGGLNTRSDSFRAGLRPATVLATVGVLITCIVTGLFAAWILDFGLLEGMLVGAVVGSTDAAAVFALLRAKGLALKQRVSATLEIESGSNDPMAVLLTIVLIELILSGQRTPGWETLGLFAQQMGMGLVAGLGGGRLLVWLTNRLPLERGMYPMLVLAGGLALYSLTTVLGGSGFLAVYLIGVVVGNGAPRESSNILQVHNGLAWLAQIGMFLMLGLLATPSSLLEHAPAALAIALVLMFVARPLAVALCLLPFHFPWREQAFIAWVGLRGAVPLILALFPLLAGVPEAALILDVAFFVVLISLTVQGWTIPALARRLRLQVPPAPTPTERFDLASAPAGGHAFFGYRLTADGPFIGRAASALRLPGEARLMTVLRNGLALMPESAGELAAGDTLYVLAHEADNAALGDLLAAPRAPTYLEKRQFYGDFVLRGDSGMASVAAQYGLPLPPEMSDMTLEAFITRKLPGIPVVGDRVRLGKLEFVVRAIIDGRIRQVGLRIPTHLVDAP